NTKSRSGNRILALTSEVEEFLLSLKQKQSEYKKLFGNTYNDNDFVCKWENGEPLKCDYISNRFRHILKNNNMRTIKFHSLRHSCATALVNSNEVSLATVQAMLGHSTLDMTRKYIHPDMQEKIKAANSVSNLIKKVQTVVKVG
ncbi:MAG: tyrosine-type recombinase/integrase, partial [Clostridia bacterium]|nr:tyrosine-type recombinase/integrase [Clostridia bacterium]